MNTVPYRRIVILQEIEVGMIRHAISELPNECCGMLGGRIDKSDGVARITHRYPLSNVVRSPTRFRADAGELLLTQRRMRADSVELIAIYHSHPSSQPVPSQLDINEHFYGEAVSCVIVGMIDDPPLVRAWGMTDSGIVSIEWENEF